MRINEHYGQEMTPVPGGAKLKQDTVSYYKKLSEVIKIIIKFSMNTCR
jgi:hypothetical protein